MARRIAVEIVGDSASLERAFIRSSKSATKFEKDISKASRGAAAGSGLFQGFGRSIAFASGGFLAFESASKFLRDSVDAAREAVVSQRSLAAQMKASGESFRANKEQIDKTALSYGKFGFQNDEVIQSLTVLERGTGSINQALKLQGLTADLARAKSIGLADAANVVAKVFGGQETALRRAVPGLEKNAHGWDLIRLAQAKLAGQAAANTTAAERFQATLHDTEEIIGTALLPTLNRYLGSLTKWLEKMNESGKLQRDVAAAAHVLSDATAVVKGAFDGLNAVTGSTKRSLELLLGAFVAFKSLKLASTLVEVAGNLGLVGAKAAESAGKVGGLRGSLVRLVANPYTVTFALVAIGAEVVARKIAALQKQALDAQAQTFKKGDPLETTLVPRLAKQIQALKAAGKTGAQILATLRKQLGGSLKADDLIAEAFSFGSGSDPKLKARIEKQVRGVTKTVQAAAAGAAKGPRPTGLQGRFNVQELKLAQAQLTATMADDRKILVVEKAITEQQIAQAKTLKEKTALTSQLAGIVSQIRGIDQQATETQKQQAQTRRDAAKATREHLKAARDQAQQTRMDWAELALEKAQTTKGVADDIKAQKAIIALIQQEIKLRGRTVDLARQLFENQQNLKDLMKQRQPGAQAGNRVANGFVGPGGQNLGTVVTSFGGQQRPPKFLPPPPGLRLPGQQAGVVINGGVHLHGVQDVKGLEQELGKRAGQRSHPRRGK